MTDQTAAVLEHQLCQAVRSRDLAKVRELLANGANASAPTAHQVPIIQAAGDGNLDVVKVLLAAGADPNRRSPQYDSPHATPFDKESAIDRALFKRFEDIVVALVEAGADPARPLEGLNAGLLPRDAVEAAGLTRALAALEARNAPRTPDDALALTPAAVAGRTERISHLLAAGTDERARDNALLMAAQMGQAAVMKLLVAEGVSAKAVQNAMYYPIQNGHLEAVRVLLDAGVDLAAETGYHGPPALIVAATNGRTEIAKLLIARGANPNQRHQGETPLSEAAAHPETLEAIKAAGADAKAEQKLRTATKKKLEPHARPAWRPNIVRGEGDARGSRLGGHAWLAADETWPLDRDGVKMECVAQLDLAALPDAAHVALPELGRGLVRVFRSATTFETTVLVTTNVDGALGDGEGVTGAHPRRGARAITGWRELDADMPNGEVGIEAHSIIRITGKTPLDAKIVGSLNHAGHKLGGWPHWVQEPAYPRRGGLMIAEPLLLQIDDGDDIVGFLFRSTDDPSGFAFREQKL